MLSSLEIRINFDQQSNKKGLVPTTSSPEFHGRQDDLQLAFDIAEVDP